MMAVEKEEWNDTKSQGSIKYIFHIYYNNNKHPYV